MECQLQGEELEHVRRFDPFAAEPGRAGDGKEAVADSEDEELVERVEGLGKKKKQKVVVNEKAAVALKNHSEAERRRRERINAHLATLRGLLPSNNKKVVGTAGVLRTSQKHIPCKFIGVSFFDDMLMDKATLLAEVINRVKDLQKHVRQVSEGLLMPMDADELTVEPLYDESQNGAMTFKASLCCDFRPDLFSDLRQAIGSLKVKTLHSEVSTLGERVKTLFILSGHDARNGNGAEGHESLRSAILEALSSILHKPSPLPEYSLRTTLSQKRFKPSFEDYSPRSVLSRQRFRYSSFESSSSST